MCADAVLVEDLRPTAPPTRDRPSAAEPAPDDVLQRRTVLAHAIVQILRRSIADTKAVEIVLWGADAGVAPRAHTRLVIHGPDALARLLLPPSGDASPRPTSAATSTSRAT